MKSDECRSGDRLVDKMVSGVLVPRWFSSQDRGQIFFAASVGVITA